jgi:hypothetical protein
MNYNRISRYVVSGRKKVDGWFSRVDAEIFSTLTLTQLRFGVKGDAMEIGVHHRRSFIAINLCLDESERAIAIDIFDRQELNRDYSGRGNRKKFEQNVRYYGDSSKVEIISASSLDITIDKIKQFTSALRFVSIDGGHWYDAVINDLTLAASCASPECIVAIDDFFNPDFPEVAAACYCWRVSNSDFTPLCISQGKLYIYRGSIAEQYYSSMTDNNYLSFNCKKLVQFIGNKIPLYTGSYSGIRGFVGQYTSFYVPSFHTYVKARIHRRGRRNG